jgi:hypothetical protein
LVAADPKKLHLFPLAHMTGAAASCFSVVSEKEPLHRRRWRCPRTPRACFSFSAGAGSAGMSTFFSVTGATAAFFIVSTWFL